MKITSMNMVPIIAVSTVMIAVLAAAKVRSRKRRRSKRGEVVRSSHQIQTASRAPPPTHRPTTAPEIQPHSLPWMIASVRQKRPALTKATPGQSRAARVRGVCRLRRSVSARMTPSVPTGRLNQKTAGQPQYQTSTPPSTGPAVFWFNLPVGTLGVILALTLLRSLHTPRTRAALDWPGVAFVSAGLFCLTLAIIQGNEWGWISGAVVGLCIGGAALLAVWIWWELRTTSPLFDLRLFRDRTFAAASTAIMTVDTAMMGTMFMLVIFMIAMMDYS